MCPGEPVEVRRQPCMLVFTVLPLRQGLLLLAAMYTRLTGPWASGDLALPSISFYVHRNYRCALQSLDLHGFCGFKQVLPHLQGKCLTHWAISSTPRFQILVFLMSYFIYLLFIKILLDNQYINVLFIKNGYCKSVGYLFLVLASIICLQKPHKFITLNFGLKRSTIFWHSSDFFWNNRVYN